MVVVEAPEKHLALVVAHGHVARARREGAALDLAEWRLARGPVGEDVPAAHLVRVRVRVRVRARARARARVRARARARARVRVRRRPRA